MSEYVVIVPSVDFEGHSYPNMFFVSGIEAAWCLYNQLKEIFDDVALVDLETGEIIDVYDAFALSFGYSPEDSFEGYEEESDIEYNNDDYFNWVDEYYDPFED